VLLVGVGHESNTFLHTIEDTGPTPSTSRILFEPKLIDYDGRVLTVPTFPHLPGLSRNFGAADAFCRQRGLQRDGTIGAAAVRLVDARGFYLAAQEALAADPLFFIDRDHYRGRSAAAEQPGA
jgi:aminoglycoside N3'-acetyltransferase